MRRFFEGLFDGLNAVLEQPGKGEKAEGFHKRQLAGGKTKGHGEAPGA
jgi:hypothetical protein